MKIRSLMLGLVLLGAGTPGFSALLDPTVDGNEFSARIEVNGLAADLTIRFEEVVGLSLDNLGISTQVLDPLDVDLLDRLPGDATSLPAAFPLLIRVDPPADGGLAFEGVVEIELYTQNLHYTIGTPLRLFTAPTGSGTFKDITEQVGSGSYRTRGGGTHFSDFIIVLDTRSTESAVADKFTRLEDVLGEHQADIGGTLHSQLSTLTDEAETAWFNGDPATAIRRIDDFRQAVRNASSVGQLPNVWRSAGDLDNVDGALRATARTLRFSLTRAANLL